jgi:hypothetical protein
MAFRLPAEGGPSSVPVSRSGSSKGLAGAYFMPMSDSQAAGARQGGGGGLKWTLVAANQARESLNRSEDVNEGSSPLFSPAGHHRMVRTPVREQNFLQEGSDRGISRFGQLSVHGVNQKSKLGSRPFTPSSRFFQLDTLEADPKDQKALNEEYAKLTIAIHRHQVALSALRLKRSASEVEGNSRSEAILVRFIEVSRLQRSKRSLQARYYTACQKIENTKRRLNKISQSLGVSQGHRSKEHDRTYLRECSEAQLQEMLDCEKLEFKSKIEFEVDLHELLARKLAKLESLEQAKSLIRRIPGDVTNNREIDSNKVLEKMRENKNTMTTEKILMINRLTNSQQGLDHSVGIRSNNEGESEQTYSPPKGGRLDFGSKRIAVKAIPEIKISHHKRTFSEEIPREMFLAPRSLDVILSL